MKIWRLETKINGYKEYYDINELDDKYIQMIYDTYNYLSFKYILKSSIIKNIKIENITNNLKNLTFILNNKDIYIFSILEFNRKELNNDSK